jgi:hypothetical protein
MPAFKPMARPILFQFLLVAGLLLMISTGARCQVYVDPIFTPANMNGNGSSFVSLPGFEEYTWKGWCRIYTDPCAPRVKLENMLEGTFFNSSSPGDPPSKVTWSMEGHAHVGPCSNPGGHWQQNKSMPGDALAIEICFSPNICVLDCMLCSCAPTNQAPHQPISMDLGPNSMLTASSLQCPLGSRVMSCGCLCSHRRPLPSEPTLPSG